MYWSETKVNAGLQPIVRGGAAHGGKECLKKKTNVSSRLIVS